MTTRAASEQQQHELYNKFKTLEKYKKKAINKVMSKFYAVPLEHQDLEHLAWKTFLEVEKIFNRAKGRKTYEAFYRDCLYWRAKDYCVKYSSNKHKVCNLSNDWTNRLKAEDYVDKTDEKLILDKLAIRAYITYHNHDEKGLVSKLYMMNYRPVDICRDLKMSKSKLYRIMSEIRKDLGRILDRAD